VRIVFDGRTIRARRTGVGYFVERLLRALMEHDRRNEYVILLNDETAVAGWPVPDNCRVLKVEADYECHPSGDLWERYKLPKLLERERADLFHGPAFRVPHTRCPCPTIVTVYDMTCWRCPSDYPLRFRHYMRWLIRRSCKWADAIIATSHATAGDLRDLLGLPESKVHVIYGAADERFRPAETIDRQRLASIHPALAEPYILTVGTVEPRKRIPLLVAAYEKARARASLHHSLVIVGKKGWKSRKTLRAMARSSAASSIRYLGYVGEDDLVAIYQGADLFVSASRFEGFGLTVLEAMACGRPVVATAGGALAEIVGDAGLVVEGEDADPLADAIASLLTDKMQLWGLARKSLATAAQFSWKTTADQITLCYQKVAR